jgi:hypothetical protein
MPRQLQAGTWGAALLAEPYATIAEQDYGDQELADTNQGTTENFPMDGYVATSVHFVWAVDVGAGDGDRITCPGSPQWLRRR